MDSPTKRNIRFGVLVGAILIVTAASTAFLVAGDRDNAINALMFFPAVFFSVILSSTSALLVSAPKVAWTIRVLTGLACAGFIAMFWGAYPVAGPTYVFALLGLVAVVILEVVAPTPLSKKKERVLRAPDGLSTDAG